MQLNFWPLQPERNEETSISTVAKRNNDTVSTTDKTESNVEKKLHIASHYIANAGRLPFFGDDPKEDKELFMTFCSVCGEWYHKGCENILVAIFRDDEKAAVWKCSKCKQKQKHAK